MLACYLSCFRKKSVPDTDFHDQSDVPIESSSTQEEIQMLNNTDPDKIEYFMITGRYKARITSIYDGDTFSVLFMRRGEIIKYRCRCVGYDCPEMKPLLSNPNREKEKELAVKARERFIELVKTSDGLIEIECVGFDKYGRLLTVVFNGRDDKSVNEMMIEEGHGKPYYGGKKEMNW